LLPWIPSEGGAIEPIRNASIRNRMAAGTLTPEQKARVRATAVSTSDLETALAHVPGWR
jgi:hypothetical protein